MASLIDRFKHTASLPVLPGSAVRLVQALNGDDLGMDEIEKIVRTDEAIAAAVLRQANSAAYGGAEASFSLQQSITRLGARRLQRLALSLSCGRLLEDAGKGYGLLRGDLWRGSLCGALGAEMLANETGLADPSLCFVGGLMRDVGKLAMDLVFNVASLEAAFRREHPDMDQLEIERSVFDIDHAELGAALCRMWKLPERLCRTVEFHHMPPGGGEDGGEQDVLIDIVHCADALTCWLAIGVGHDGLAYRLSERAAATVGFDRERIERALPALRAELAAVEEQMAG